MADGTYERRGPREAELKRLQRILDERRRSSSETNPKSDTGAARRPVSP
jgi:hypothetical protein